MNLVKAAELLKNAPEDTLKKYLANPNGEFPEYLVASEIERRRDMRQRYANELEGKPPKTSIIQELLQRDTAALRQPQQPQMPPEAMGLGAVPPPPGMQLSQAPIMDAAQQPQQFYGGGAVAFADGGLSVNPDDYKIDPSLIEQRDIPAVQDLSYYQNQASEALGPSALSGYQDVLTKQRADLEANKKNYLPDFLIQAGLGMAGSKSVHPLQAAAEGATLGFKAYQQAKTADEQAARNLTESEFKFKQAERAEKAGLFGLSRQLYNDAQSQRNVAIDNNRQAQALKITSANALQTAKYHAGMFGLEGKKLDILRSNVGSEAALRGAQIENYKQNQRLREEALKLRGQPKPLAPADIAKIDLGIRTKDPGYLSLERELRKKAQEDPAIALLAQSQLDSYVKNRLKDFQSTYTYADLVGSGQD